MTDPQYWSSDLHEELRLLRRRLAELEGREEERVRVDEHLRRQIRYLSVLADLTPTLMKRLDRGDLLSGILDRVNSLLDTTHSFVALNDPVTGSLEVRVATGSLLPAIGVRFTGSVRTSDAFRHCGAIAEIALRTEELAFGILGVARVDDKPFDEWDLDVLHRFGDLASIALRNAHLFEAEHEARGQAETLLATAKALGSTLRLPDVLKTILEQLGRVVPCDSASVQEIRENESVVVAGIGFERIDEIIGIRFDIANPAIPNGVVVQSRQPLILQEISPFRDFRKATPSAGHIRSWMGVPLIAADHVVGLITLDKNEPHFYTEDHARLAVAFAAHAAMAIENARLYAASHQQTIERNRITERLNQSEASYRTLVEQLPAITYRWSVSDKNTGYISPQIETLLGYTPEEWLGDPDLWWKVLHPDDRKWVIEAMVAKDETGSDLDITHRLVARDGRVLWFQNQSKTLFERGRPVETHGVMLDVTHLKQIEERLLEANADLEQLFQENARLFAEEKQSRLVAERLQSIAQVLNESLDLDAVLHAILDQIRQVIDYDMASIQLVEHDVMRVIAVRGVPESEIGRVRPLADYPYNQRLATDERPVILDIGPDETSWRANLEYLRPIRCNIGIPMKARDRIIGALMLDSRQPNFYSERDLRIATAFGRQAAVAVENARLYMAAQRELQDRIRAEEALVRAKEAADDASRAKSAFLATMSHELRTPLNAIIGFSAVLDEKIADKLNEKQLRFLRNINVSGEYLLHIINDILDLSKIEAGKMTIDPEEVGAAESIEAICRVVKGMALPRNIELRTEVEPDLGSLWADPIRLKQILYNLLSNAVKFSPDGSTVLTKAQSLSAHASALRRESIEITVVDQGPGIAPEDRQVIFEEFRQLNRSSRRPQGTGLGLALVNRLVQLMGGTIRLRSEVGKGSEFSVVLPRGPRH